MFNSAESTFISLWLFFVFCFWIGCLSILLFRLIRLKTGRYLLVVGHVIMIHDISGRYTTLNQSGSCATVEYNVAGATYRTKIGSHLHGGLKPIYNIGERVKLICDAKHPQNVFLRHSFVLYFCLLLASIMLLIGAVLLFKEIPLSFN